MTASATTRLHVTPFNADLLPIVLSSNLAKVAENIAFRPIETFPENNYGFLDLPESDAKVLMTKLNGAILKGRKMKVEKARPKKRPHPIEQEDGPDDLDKAQKKARKQKHGEGVLEGHQLSPERKVKRGWTNPKPDEPTRSRSKEKRKKESKHQAASRYTDKEELLFRTKLPPNRGQPTQSKSKKQKKQGGETANETIVHEFENNDVQPVFVRDTTSSAPVAQYIDQVGWVDRKGDVVEGPSSSASSRRMMRKAEGLRIGIPISTGAKTSNKQFTSSLSTSPESNSSSATRDDDRIETDLQQEDATSTSESSSSNAQPSSQGQSDEDETGRDQSQNTLQVDVDRAPATPDRVHPLEALFKKPKPRTGQEPPKPSLEIETAFSFFDQAATDEADELPPMPTTPFTSLDMGSRGVRSAAPTPDTAHPSRFASFASALTTPPAKEHSREEALGNHDATVAGERSQSDFEKRFWAERGQNNRAWKTRRKSAIKEARQKENRLRRTRNW